MPCFERLRHAWASWLLAAIVASLSLPAQAHKASDAYLQLQQVPAGIDLRWDIALRDLDAALELDADADGRITWGEIKAAWPRIDDYALARLAIDGCPLRLLGHALEQRSDGAYAVLQLHSDCAMPKRLSVAYSLQRDVDPTHRGLLKIDRIGQPVELRVLDPTAPDAVASAATQLPGDSTAPLPSFLEEGIRHILTGYDHVLFLFCLLLPAVMRRTPHGWRPVERLPEALMPLFTIVTTFTVAHSITLGLAALKVVSIPPRVIEPAIAVTIIAAAIDNLVPLFRGRRGIVTFCFGLIHGFGFADALAELALPTRAFAWALLQFNVGLELGQLSIVVTATLLLFSLRRATAYPRWAIQGGSALAMGLGAVWLIERTAGITLLAM